MTISASGKEKLTKSTSGRTHNTSIDSSIDLKSYIASAKKTNQEIIENAGTQINAKTSEYMSTGKAFRAALTESILSLLQKQKHILTLKIIFIPSILIRVQSITRRI